MIRSWQTVACAAAGLAVTATLFLPPIRHRVNRSDNDFQVSYISGQLMARRQLFNATQVLQTERAISASIHPDLLDTRLPFLALVFWPLAQLPYQVAWPLWAAVLTGAVMGLLWISIALRIRHSRPFLTGLVLALCAAKFHLFPPLLLWCHRLWQGLVAGAAALLPISFAVAGRHWPLEYAAIMSNLHGLLVSRHAYMQDCALLLPALLIVLPTARGAGLLLGTRLAILAFLGYVVVQVLPAVQAYREAHAV